MSAHFQAADIYLDSPGTNGTLKQWKGYAMDTEHTVLARDKRISELEDAKDAALSLLEVAESEADRLRTLFQKSKKAMLRAEAALKDVKQERKELRTAIRNLANDFNDLGERCGAAESALASARAETAEFKSRHTATGCGKDATTGRLHVMITGVARKKP